MFAVNLIIYAAFLAGLYLVTEKEIGRVKRRIDLRKRLNGGGEKKRSPAGRWIEQMLQTVSGDEVNADSFITFLIFLFVFVFLLSARNFTLPLALTASAAITSLPVLVLAVKVETARTKGSMEGISLVTEFYRQYRMKGTNVYEAIEATVDADGEYPNCRKQLYKLLLRLRASGNPDEIRESLDAFAFALGTTWGKMFATCLRMSVEKGADVSEGIADIITQLKNANAMAEDRKRLNSESARMTMFLVPILYIGTMLLGVYYLDVSPASIFKNQFMTPEGLLFFMVIVFLFVFNLILLKLVDNTRLDY